VPGVDEVQVKEALDLETPMSNDLLEAAVAGLVDRATAFLERGGTIAGLRTMHGRGELRAAAILRVVQPRIFA
jgi:hypothetical protein